MMKMSFRPVRDRVPDLSIIMPCYNEESVIGYTIPKLVSAFENAGYFLELVVVDNGSWDRTAEIIKELAARNASVVYHRVEKNQGYGFGVLSGIPVCKGPWIGAIPADGQVDAEDVVRLFEAAEAANGKVLAKVRRRFRMDGLLRKVVSTGFNVFVRVLWPQLRSIDINGSPKLLPAECIRGMNLKSRDWFLDAEIMVKAHYMGLRVLELNVFGRLRGNGLSHIRMGTCWEFLRNLLVFRFTRRWQQDFAERQLDMDGLATPELRSQ
jgi:glycosyltransferase involved in cell wall biosynthesis